jgi:hypothetical protein
MARRERIFEEAVKSGDDDPAAFQGALVSTVYFSLPFHVQLISIEQS